MQWTRLGLWDFCEYTSSYLSVVEIGLYEASVRLYTALAGEGLAPGSEEWAQRVNAEVARQREALASRLWPAIPPRPLRVLLSDGQAAGRDPQLVCSCRSSSARR